VREQRSIVQNIDWPLLVIYIALVTMGWLNIYAAVYDPQNISLFDLDMQYGKQAMFIGICALVGTVILFTDGKLFPTFSFWIYAFMMLLLVATIFLGKNVHGSKSWLNIGGGFSLQPAELAKFATCLALARFLGEINVKMEKLQTRLICAAIIGFPVLIILLQNETGLAIVYFSFVFVMYREGLPGGYLLLGFAVLVLFILTLLVEKAILFSVIGAIAILVFMFLGKRRFSRLLRIAVVAAIAIGFTLSVDYIFTKVLQPHQSIRITALLGKIDPSQMKEAKKGVLYNVNQSKIAIGSGGLVGKGWTKGTQTKYDFVPEQDTDFIFCTVGEEWGFLGSTTVLLLFMTLILRIIYIGERQKAPFTRIYAYGVASILMFHLMVNVGMTLGLMPVIGIPLPFFSYGGSSLLGFTILLFILIRLDSYRMQIL
jgi:rod shape determining protein RodA